MSDEPSHLETNAQGNGQIRSGKLAGKTLWAAIWIVTLPVLVQQTMQACVGLVDSMLAGRLPDEIALEALDAISVGAYVTWFILIAMTGLGIGGQALIARAMGAGNRLDAEKALGQAVVLSLFWGAIVGVAMWFGVDILAAICNLTDDAADMLSDYVRIIAVSLPMAGLMLVGAMCLYGAGETMLPSLISIGVNVVNIIVSWALSGVDLSVGDWTLINPFSFDLHVVGIAAGTAISYAFGGLMTVWVLVRGVKDLRLEAPRLRPDRSTTGRLVRVGLPGFFDSLMMWTANILVLLLIGMIAQSTGSDGVPREGLQGAHLIALRWESFSFLPGFALGTAAGALAGQYLGAGNPSMAQRSILMCVAIASVLMGLLGLVFIFGGDVLTRIISNDELHRAQAPPLLLIAGLVQVFFAITMVLRQGLRGVGDTRWTFLITSASSYGIRLPAAWWLGVHLHMGLTGIWLGLCGELVIRSGLFAARFYHGGWKRIKV
ncbi:MAG: MATE family efflux transporter [Phycisphaerales bacterium]